MTSRTAFAIPLTFSRQLHVRLSRQSLPRRSPIHSLPHRPISPPSAHTLMSSTSPTPTPSPAPLQKPSPPTAPTTTLLYDGECPLCMKEINFLRARQDRLNRVALNFVDIASPSYDPAQHAGIDYETAMGVMHAITPEGKIVTGVPVFRLAYDAVGLGWVYSVTKVPGVGWLADRVYDIWAKFRLRLTGRPEMDVIMQMRRDEIEKGCR